jgi:hypothetical protein
MGVPKNAVTMSANDIKFLFGGLDSFAVLPSWGGRAVVMSCWEGAMAVGASGVMSAVGSRRSVVHIDTGAAVIAALVPGALRWVTEALAARVVSSNCGLLVDWLRQFARIEEPEWAYRSQEGHYPSDPVGLRVRSVSGGAAADWRLLGLGHHLLGDQFCRVGDDVAGQLPHCERDTRHRVIVPGFGLPDGGSAQNP